MRLVSISRASSLLAVTLLVFGCGGGADVAPSIESCALPNVLARVVSTAVPDEPPIAVQEGIAGPVSVLVTLDTQSVVTSAVVQASRSVLLDASAIRAADASTYRTAIANCVPVSASIVIVFRYPVVPLPAPGP